MNRRIQLWVSLFFDNLPYSDQAAKARGEVEKKLIETCPDANPEQLAEQYGSYEQLAELAGYTSEDAQAWKNTEDLRDDTEFKKELKAQQRRIIIIALLSAFILGEISWSVYNAVARNTDFFWTLGFGVLYAVIAGFLIRKVYRVEKEHRDDRFSVETFRSLRSRSDQYTKNLLNSIATFFGAMALFIGSELSFYVFGNSKSAELVENIFANLIFIELPLMLLVNDSFNVKILQNRIGLPPHKRLKHHIIGIVLFSLFYWIVVITGTIMLREYFVYPANVFIIAAVIFMLLIFIYNLTLRRRVTFRNITVNKLRFGVIMLAAAVVIAFMFMSKDTYYTQPYINSLPVVEHTPDRIEYDDNTGIYTITSNEDDFKILHLTDIHLGGSLFSYMEDHKALEACYKLIENTHPDLVIVTGDLCFPLGIMSLSFNNSAPIYQFSSFMRNLGIPWAFTYGNHDTESMASLNPEELNDVFKTLSYKTSGTLLYPYVQPDVMGRNNQLIEVRNSDGSLNTGLFLIDSNAYTGEGVNVYDYIHDDQVDWYASEVKRMNEEAGTTIPSMLFFHIPLQQYRTAYELYEKGSDEVTYYFGENNETAIDKICCSDYPSKLFDTAKEIGGEAMFCGHDHYNNMSLEYQGVRLTYGMSIDYLVMPGIGKDTAQRGGELITIHQDGSWDLRQIPLESIMN